MKQSFLFLLKRDRLWESAGSCPGAAAAEQLRFLPEFPSLPHPPSSKAWVGTTRHWGQFRGTSWKGGHGGQEPLPGLGEVSTPHVPGLALVPTAGNPRSPGCLPSPVPILTARVVSGRLSRGGRTKGGKQGLGLGQQLSSGLGSAFPRAWPLCRVTQPLPVMPLPRAHVIKC